MNEKIDYKIALESHKQRRKFFRLQKNKEIYKEGIKQFAPEMKPGIQKNNQRGGESFDVEEIIFPP